MKTRTFHELLPVPVQYTVFSNGLTVMTAETGSGSVGARLVFCAGSMKDRIPGEAHALEHSLMEGPDRTGAHPKLRRLLQRGMKYGAGVDERGSYYWIRAYRKDLRNALRGLFDVCCHPIIDQKSVDEERGPILREIDEHWRREKYLRWKRPLLYPHKRGCHHMPGGTIESVKIITAGHLLRFHEAYYGAKNAALIVTGGVNHDDVLRACEELTGLLSSSTTTITRRQSIGHPKIVNATYTDDPSTSSIELYWSGEGLQDAPRLAHLPLALYLLTSAPFGLLHRRLRIKNQQIYGTSASFLSWLNTISIKVPAYPNDHASIEKEIHRAIRTLVRNKFSQESWKTAMSLQRRSVQESRENVPYSWAGDILQLRWLQNGPYDVDPDTWILQSTREEVARAAELYLDYAKCGRIRSIAKRDQ